MSGITTETSHMAEVIHEKGDSMNLAATDELSEDTAGDGDTSVYIDGWSLAFLALALMSSGFMLSLDDTILCTDPRLWVWRQRSHSNIHEHKSNGHTPNYE